MYASTSIIVLCLASAISATPLILQARDSCGQVPSASGSQNPLSQPSANTADLCKQACAANPSCKSFVFGLPASATSPSCELFAVPVAQVPPQQTNLRAFDIGCSDVPTSAPTSANPVGLTAAQQQQQQSPGSTGSSNQGANNGNNGQAGSGSGQRNTPKRNVCGAAPTGPSTGSPTPLQTNTAVADGPACLALCKSTPRCQSVEFGTVNGAPQCRLFNVPAAQLPAPANGQSFVAFDAGC